MSETHSSSIPGGNREGRRPQTARRRASPPFSTVTARVRAGHVDPRALEKLLRVGGANALIDLTVEGRPSWATRALVKELQRHPIRGTIMHADLFQVDLTRTVEVEVPVHLVGKPKGIDFGASRALAARDRARVPTALDSRVDRGRRLQHGDRDVIHVRDLALPAGVSLVTDPDLGVVHVALPAAEEEAPWSGRGGAEPHRRAGEAAPAAARLLLRRCEEVRLGAT